jgi:hypothetical protein
MMLPSQLSRLIVSDSRGLSVNFAHLGLGDDDVPAILSALEVAGGSTPSRGPASVALTLVFEMNFFGDAAIRNFLVRFRAWSAPGSPLTHLWVHRLRLHMNRLSDDACDALATFLCEMPAAYLPGELHLSHNRISSAGALALVAAAAKRYPRAPRSPDAPPIPLWLRLEHNVVNAGEVRRRAAGVGARWCPGETAGRGGGRGGGRSVGGRGGRGRGGAARCGASVCLTNNALAKRARGGAGRGGGGRGGRGSRGGGGGGGGGGAGASAAFAHVHLCFLDEQRPVSTRTGASLAGLVRGSSRAVARAIAAPAPECLIAALAAPAGAPDGFGDDGDDDGGDSEGAGGADDAEGGKDDSEATDSDGAFDGGDGCAGGAARGEGVPVRAVYDEIERAPTPAADESFDASAPGASAPAPLFVVLDTSAVVRMVERGAEAAPPPFSFAAFGASTLRGGIVWVLLDTVLQQLDDSKRASAYLSRAVNAFMRLYPQLEAVGALARLAAEDVEDAVRAGANVVSQPGCRTADGRFDSDGVIIDASLLVLRSLAAAAASDARAQLLLLTADVGMRNRAMGVGLPAALWEDVNRRFAPGAALTSATLVDALPEPSRAMLRASGGGGLAAGGGGASAGGGGAAPDGEGARGTHSLGALSGRSATLELRAAVGVVTHLAAAARALLETHGCGGAACAQCAGVRSAADAADAAAHGWQQVVAAKMGASSLHARLGGNSADVAALTRGFAAAGI